MKTLTCKELGGPCELELPGESADEVIKAQDRHLKEAARSGDETHQPARQAMTARWRHPRQSMQWYNDAKQAFADRPES